MNFVGYLNIMYLTNALKIEHIQKMAMNIWVPSSIWYLLSGWGTLCFARNAFPGVCRSVTNKPTNFETVCILFPSTQPCSLTVQLLFSWPAPFSARLITPPATPPVATSVEMHRDAVLFTLFIIHYSINIPELNLRVFQLAVVLLCLILSWV